MTKKNIELTCRALVLLLAFGSIGCAFFERADAVDESTEDKSAGGAPGETASGEQDPGSTSDSDAATPASVKKEEKSGGNDLYGPGGCPVDDCGFGGSQQ